VDSGAGRERATTQETDHSTGPDLRVVEDGQERTIDTAGTTEADQKTNRAVEAAADAAAGNGAPVDENRPAGRPQANARFTSRKGPQTPEQEQAEAALRTMWEEFKSDADPAVRERLIMHYSPLVKYVAGRVGVGLPPNIEQADLVSYGIFGLIDAIEKFDIERAIKFETYAISRIGAQQGP
jgi:RNA polymerase sigma factor for flagellar operon FliA